MKKFDEEIYLVDMYEDGYFPDFLVDKIKALLQGIVTYLENGEHSLEDIQLKFDEMTERINVLNEEFYNILG